jgi:hypothetical protein
MYRVAQLVCVLERLEVSSSNPEKHHCHLPPTGSLSGNDDGWVAAERKTTSLSLGYCQFIFRP